MYGWSGSADGRRRSGGERAPEDERLDDHSNGQMGVETSDACASRARGAAQRSRVRRVNVPDPSLASIWTVRSILDLTVTNGLRIGEKKPN